MANPNKRFKNCKPNRKPSTAKTFTQFVDGFCIHQESNGSAICRECGGMALCEKTAVTADRAIGTFVCQLCGHERDLSVLFTGLRQDYNKVVEVAL